MREAAAGAIRLTRGCSLEEFAADVELMSSVERALRIIGREAALVDPALRATHGDVPWRQLIGAARVLEDEDDGLEPDELWAFVRELPALFRAISRLIPEDEPDW
jgi:uncharacterized protein with HEPN domain